MVGIITITDIMLSDSVYNEECLIAELTIVNTPGGRLLCKALDSPSLQLYTIGYADETNVDGVEIMTSGVI